MEALSRTIPNDIIKYNITDVAIQALDEKYQNMTITNGTSYKAVVVGIGEIRAYRVEVEKKRKELKRDALEFGRAVDGEAKRITGLLLPIESRLKEVKQVEDDRKAAIKAEKERIEQERVQGIRNKISDFQRLADGVNALQREQLENVMADINAMAITAEEFQEFVEEAEGVLLAVRNVVQTALETRVKLDREALQRKEETERLAKVAKEQAAEATRLAEAEAKQKAEEAKQKAELEKARQEQESKVKAEEVRLEAERQKIETEKARLEAEKQAEIERKKREAKEKQIAEAARRQAIKDAEARALREKQGRIVREKAEAEEAARLEALKPDRQKLADYAGRLASTVVPELKDSGAKDFLIEIELQLSAIITELKKWRGEVSS